MDRFYKWTALVLANWKTVLSIATLLIGLVSSGIGNILQSETVYSYKMGYEALAHNVSVSSQELAAAPDRPCKCTSTPHTHPEFKILKGFHALN